MKVSTRRERERLRESFRPPQIRLLFIGESPPASGRFFYSANSGLYRAMRTAFQVAGSTVDDKKFLAMFQECGCYLTDLCVEPIDHLGSDERRALRREGEKHLARQLKCLRPVMIGPVLRSIIRNVQNAVSLAHWHGEIVQFPYPGRWSQHREAFIKSLVPIIQRLNK